MNANGSGRGGSKEEEAFNSNKSDPKSYENKKNINDVEVAI